MKETVNKHRVLRVKRLVHFSCFCVFLGLVAAGCSLPQAPGDLSWDTHLVIPLGVRTYGIIDLVESDSLRMLHGSGVGMDSTGIVFFSAFTKVKVPLGDSLVVEPTDTTLIKPPNTTDFVGFASLPPQRHRMTRGTVAHGTLSLILDNMSGGTTGPVQITVPSFTHGNGTPLQIIANTVSTIPWDTTVDLRNYIVTLGIDTPQTVELQIHGPLGAAIRMVTHLSRISFIYYSGTIADLPIPGLSSGTSIERLPEGYDAVKPTTVNGIVKVHGNPALTATSLLGVEIRTYLNEATLAFDSLHSSGLYLARDTTVYQQGLAGLIQEYPDSMSAAALMTVTGSVTNLSGSDTVLLNIEMRAPLSFTMDTLHAPGNDQIRKVDNSEFKDIERDGSKAIIRIWNHLPVSGRVYLVADRDSLNLLSTSNADVDTVVDVPIREPQMVGGRAVADTMTEIILPLDSATVELLKHPPFYTRTDVGLNSSHGDTLIANAGDYVKVQIIADVMLHVDTRGHH